MASSPVMRIDMEDWLKIKAIQKKLQCTQRTAFNIHFKKVDMTKWVEF